MTSPPGPKVLNTRQVAELLDWSVGYVRKGMARNGIKEVRGWPEDQVRALLTKQEQVRGQDNERTN